MGRRSQSRGLILARIQPLSIIMPIRNVAAAIGADINPPTMTGLLTNDPSTPLARARPRFLDSARGRQPETWLPDN